jgi:2-methylisocitrate lyase-like PEP mutase family enzyme
MSKPAHKLRTLVATNSIIPMPCAWDALSARMISQAGC